MPEASSGGLRIYYETDGDPAGPPLLLVAGLGAQLTWWPSGFRAALAAAGFRVICFDNRDAGLSSWLDEAGPADLLAILAGTVAAPYLLTDMAADAVAVLDAAGAGAAHVLGASMGGMIAQALAIEYPARVTTLTSMMSSTGDPAVGRQRPDITEMLLSPRPPDKAAVVEQGVAFARAISSPAYGFDAGRARARLAGDFDRGHHPEGAGRQLAAILADGDRTAALGALAVPALVIHGDADPMVEVSGGLATAAAIPGARLRVIPGMAHDIPQALFGELAGAVAELAGLPLGRGEVAAPALPN